MDTVFDNFQETEYTFLVLNQGGVLGNTVDSEHQALGVFKDRSGMVQNTNREAVQSDATLHIRPDEPFVGVVMGNEKTFVGHGIKCSKGGATQFYRIQGYKEGFNYDSNELEFWLLTLKAESLAEVTDGS